MENVITYYQDNLKYPYMKIIKNKTLSSWNESINKIEIYLTK